MRILGPIILAEALLKARRWSDPRDPYSWRQEFRCLRLWRRPHEPAKRVASDVGEGGMAIAFVHQYLQYVGRGA
jgi:hypothetical protein